MSDRLKRIAEEAAAAYVEQKEYAPNQARPAYEKWPFLWFGSRPTAEIDTRIDDPATLCEEYRRDIAAVILAAVERALVESPVPSPVSDVKIAQARVFWDRHKKAKARGEPVPKTMLGHVDALLEHIDHLHRMLHSPEGEAIAAAFDAGRAQGFREGAAAQHELDGVFASQALNDVRLEERGRDGVSATVIAAAARVVRSVENATLATPDE